MIKIELVDTIEKINKMREEYLNHLLYAQEHFIEDKVKKCLYYKIYKNSNVVGYFCANSEKVLFEFYLDNKVLIFAQEVFKFIIEQRYIIAAECKTFDYLLMSVCLDFQKKLSCTGYLFRDYTKVDYKLNGYDDLSFRIAEKEDYNSITEISGDFFDELEENIVRKEIFVLLARDNLIGVGLCAKIVPNKDYYDIGMVVSENHRRKGIGTFIICKLKEYCCDNNYIPVCGCWYYNYASKRTLEKSGFISNHRIIKFEFNN